MDERRKVLALLAAGQIDVDQATELLEALDAPTPTPPPRPKGVARLLRIAIDTEEENGRTDSVNLNLPLALAGFAKRFVPEEARERLKAQGVDLLELLASLDDDIPEGELVNIDVEEANGGTTSILIELV